MKNVPLKIGDVTIQPGERLTLALPTPELYTCAPTYIPIHLIHGKRAGPTLLVCGAVHGDAINGVTITQRLMNLRLLKSLSGTLIVIPTINIYGLITLSRNLPDRRDPDGSFPGSESGSFASRLANLLTQEIFNHITHCIDLRTGEAHITKFPQIRTFLGNQKAKELAHAFGAPVILNTTSKQGLLWLMHRKEKQVPTIVYETGEALRLDEKGIRLGVRGIIQVMRHLGILAAASKPSAKHLTTELSSDQWIRAPSSGLCEIFSKVGSIVKKKTRLAKIFDPFGTEQKEEIFAPFDGVVIGKNNLPILNEGEPILQIAAVGEAASESIQDWSTRQTQDPSFE